MIPRLISSGAKFDYRQGSIPVARSHTGGGPERTLQIVSPPATAPRLLSLHGLASPSQHPPATLCRLGYAAAPRAALLAGALAAHPSPPCRVSRPFPRQVFGVGGGRLAGSEVGGRPCWRGCAVEATINRTPTTSEMVFDYKLQMANVRCFFSARARPSPTERKWASASKSCHLALGLARARHGLSPAKKQGRAARASKGRSPACQPAPARSYRERGSDPPSSH